MEGNTVSLICLCLFTLRYIHCTVIDKGIKKQHTHLRLRSGLSIANEIKFDIRFTDLRLTQCSELIVDQLSFIFPCIFDLQLCDRRLVDRPSTEAILCQSDWLTVTPIYGVVLNYPACTASGRHSQ